MLAVLWAAEARIDPARDATPFLDFVWNAASPPHVGGTPTLLDHGMARASRIEEQMYSRFLEVMPATLMRPPPTM